MPFVATPSQVLFLNSSATSQTITVSSTGMVSASMLDGGYASVSPSSALPIGGLAAFVVSPTGTAPQAGGGDDAIIFTYLTNRLVVPISVGGTLPSKNLPVKRSLVQAISYVRALTDLPTTPNDATLTTFLNEGLEQLSDEVEPTFNDISIPVVTGAATATLPYDVQDIVAMRYSTQPQGNVGGIEYELLELGTLEFIDATQGMPQRYNGANAGGPVLWFRRITDMSGRIRLEFSPQPPAGYLRLAYFSRPILWDVNDGTSMTNVDPAYVRLAILFACKELCRNRKDLTRYNSFAQEYGELLQSKKEKVGRRRRQRRAVVRDVTGGNSGFVPDWYPM